MASPGSGCRELPLLAEAERDAGAGGVERHRGRSCPRERCVHQLFEAQVERTPDAVAVAFDGQRLTYARAERAGQPAGAPPARAGRGPEVRGGRCAWSARWSWWWRMLGVSRRAAPTCRWTRRYPAERLAYMLRDAAAPVLVTQRGAGGRAADACGRGGAAWTRTRSRSRGSRSDDPPLRGRAAGATWRTSSTRRARRPAQGRAGGAPRRRATCAARRGRRTRLRAGGPVCCSTRRPASTSSVLRAVVARCWRAATPGDGAARAVDAGRSRSRTLLAEQRVAALVTLTPSAAGAAGERRGAAGADARTVLGGRGAARAELARSVLAGRGRRAAQRLRPDGDDGVRRRMHAVTAARPERGAHRPADRRTRGCTCWTRGMRAGAGGRGGRAVHRRRRAGARLPAAGRS